MSVTETAILLAINHQTLIAQTRKLSMQRKAEQLWTLETRTWV